MYFKKYYGLLRDSVAFAILKKTSNLALFLKENRFFSVFFGGTKIQKAVSCEHERRFLLVLSIFSYHLPVASEICEAVTYLAEFVHKLQELRIFGGDLYIKVEHEFKFFIGQRTAFKLK